MHTIVAVRDPDVEIGWIQNESVKQRHNLFRFRIAGQRLLRTSWQARSWNRINPKRQP
jgi:hypothetical protein